MSPRPLESEHPSFEVPLELAREGRHGEAVSRLLRALDGDALHNQHRAVAAGVLARIARLAEAAGDRATAASALEEAVRIAPRFADLHYQLACVRAAAHKPAEARRALEEALRINPGYVAARVELALLDAREGRLAEALDTLQRLSDRHAVEEPRVFRQGIESLEQADWEEAGALLRQALHLAEPGLEEMEQQFHRLLAQGDRTGAIRLARDALRGHESYADLHYLLGLAELEEGHCDDALSSFARALELHPDYHAARVQLARTLEALGDLVQAAEQVAMILQRDPQHPQALRLHERWTRMQRHRRRSGAEIRKAS